MAMAYGDIMAVVSAAINKAGMKKRMAAFRTPLHYEMAAKAWRIWRYHGATRSAHVWHHNGSALNHLRQHINIMWRISS